jgi:EAL domain-containing protein (putative c-di-GMP-specific phosphodiesterase class I)/GGDEF domain-containing protein
VERKMTLWEDKPEGYEQTDEHTVNRLTDMMSREEFLVKLEDPGIIAGAVVFFDVQHFKIINRLFGMSEGDRLLEHIAACIRACLGERDFACRLNADRFVFYMDGSKKQVECCVETLFHEIASFGLPFEIQCNAGLYLLEGTKPAAGKILNSVIMAQSQIKGSFSDRFCWYTEELWEGLIRDHEITGMMRKALENREFLVYYQPQYNHSTGMMVGAEALSRWFSPEKGLIPPVQFIPVFEKSGFITQLDEYVFETVCAFLRRSLDNFESVVPISVNLARHDLLTPGFLDKLADIREKYDIPARYVRIEITESSAQGNSHFINEALDKLHSYGFTVEMDDFGSGYSSLNILKDIDFDIIKLDMNFFEKEEAPTGRAGTILSSVVRMMNWLQIPLIVEGVEVAEQADFLRSIGCEFIQGYLYSKPLPEAEFEHLLRESHCGVIVPRMRLIETMDAKRFWSEDSLETLIFSNFVGGAAIVDYRKGEKLEILRVNEKYLRELGMNLSEKEVVNHDPMDTMETGDRAVYQRTIDRAIESGDEEECETWRVLTSSCCGKERICVRASMRVIGRSKGEYIFYVMIRNITMEKQRLADILDSERRFKAASEQVNIYYWEYTVATHEMRPCFRCMRDLGLPALMENYPDSAIEMGVFPPEVADLYRDWHRQIARGVPSLEAVIPLTVGRIPFHVRYTAEFDENGHPIKAYGSAALVVD